MSPSSAPRPSAEGQVTGEAVSQDTVLVRYWASARAAQGRAEERVAVPAGGVPVAGLLELVTAGREPRVAQVLAVCSLLLDETVVHADRVGDMVVRPGSTVDLLPPFAGG